MLSINRHGGVHDAGKTTDHEHGYEPRAKSMGVSKRMRPPHMVPIQLKILTPVGMAISMVRMEKAEVATTPIPVVYMW